MDEQGKHQDREWPENVSDRELGLIILAAVVAAVLLPLYLPQAAGRLPFELVFIGSLVLSAFALGAGAWGAVVLWHRRFPRTHWKRVRRRLTTAMWAGLTTCAVLLEAWPWVVPFAVLLGLQLTRRSTIVVWERLGHVSSLLAYQGDLTVTVDVRAALRHPAVRGYFIEAGLGRGGQVQFEAWVEETCAGLMEGTAVTINWKIDSLSVYKNDERQFARVVYHEMPLGAEGMPSARSAGQTNLRLCILNGCLKLQVGPGASPWRDVVSVPIFYWAFVHRLPALYMNFEPRLEHSWREIIEKDLNKKVKQRATDYARYIEAHPGLNDRTPMSWFDETLEKTWRKERDAWVADSQAEIGFDVDYVDIGCDGILECRLWRGGADYRDREMDGLLRTLREDQ